MLEKTEGKNRYTFGLFRNAMKICQTNLKMNILSKIKFNPKLMVIENSIMSDNFFKYR